MSTLYISNLGSEIHLDMDNIHLKYLGPKSLEKFICINEFDGQVIYVETQFTYGAEEEYIDVADALSDYNYNVAECLNQITNVKIAKKGDISMDNKGKASIKKTSNSKRVELIDKSLMVSDNIALVPHVGSAHDFQIEAVSMADTNKRCLIRFKDTMVLRSNMTKSLQDRSIRAIRRNAELIVEIAKERLVITSD